MKISEIKLRKVAEEVLVGSGLFQIEDQERIDDVIEELIQRVADEEDE